MPSFSVRPTSIPTREVDRAEEAAVRAEVAAEKVGQTIDLATQLIKDVADAREEMIPITSQIESIPGVINAAVNTINNTRTEAVQSINASTEAAQEGINMQATGALSAISSQETNSRSAVMTAGMNELGSIAQAKNNALADISTAKTEAIEEIGDTGAITTALTEATSALAEVTDAIEEATEALAQIDGIEEKLSNLDDNGEIDASHVKSGSTSVAAKLSQLEEVTSSLSPVNVTWIQGYYGYTGNFNDVNYRVTARDIIPCKYNDVIRVDGVALGSVLWYSILVYDANGTLLGFDCPLDTPVTYQDAAYIRINCGKMNTASGTFTPSDMSNALVWVDDKNSRIDKITEKSVTYAGEIEALVKSSDVGVYEYTTEFNCMMCGWIKSTSANANYILLNNTQIIGVANQTFYVSLPVKKGVKVTVRQGSGFTHDLRFFRLT